LAHRLSVSADRLGPFAHSSLRRLLVGAAPLHLAKGALALHLLFQDSECAIDVVVSDKDLHWICTLSDMDVARRLRRALAATHAGQRLDRSPGVSGDLRNLPVHGLDIGLGAKVSVDAAEFRARYFAVRGAAPIFVENIEENELLDAATGGTSGHASILGMPADVPRTSTIGGSEAKRHQSLQIAVPQCIAEGLKRRAQRKR